MAESQPLSSALDRPHGLRWHHLEEAVSVRGVKAEVAKVNGFNAKLAVIITSLVGSMWCAYAFCIIALLSLPAILRGTGWVPDGTFPHWMTSVGLIAIVAWVAQTFIQLVLLSVIMVGQSVQGAASDARAVHTYEDTERLLDLLDIRTEGGLKSVLDRIDALEASSKVVVTKPARRVATTKKVVGTKESK